jgi:hypothetical protein
MGKLLENVQLLGSKFHSYFLQPVSPGHLSEEHVNSKSLQIPLHDVVMNISTVPTFHSSKQILTNVLYFNRLNSQSAKPIEQNSQPNQEHKYRKPIIYHVLYFITVHNKVINIINLLY